MHLATDSSLDVRRTGSRVGHRRKGRIAEGYDADLVLVNLAESRTIDNERQWTKVRWSPWHGVTLTGWPVRTIVGGQTVYQDGKCNDSARGTLPLFDHGRGGYWQTHDGIGTR